jgi:hypothetical protein
VKSEIVLAALALATCRPPAAMADQPPPPSLPAASPAAGATTLRMLDWDDGWSRFRKQASAAHASLQGERWTALPDAARETILRMEFRILQERGIGQSGPVPGGSVTTASPRR